MGVLKKSLCSPNSDKFETRSLSSAKMSHSVLTLPHVVTPSDGLTTATYTTQLAVEENLAGLLAGHLANFTDPLLAQSSHLSFLTKLLMGPLPSGYTGLDASKPWILYWALHSLALFGGELDAEARGRVVGTLRACQNEDGGFGGGPGQFSHLAPSYAAVSALAGAGEEGWKLVDRCVSFWAVLEDAGADSME